VSGLALGRGSQTELRIKLPISADNLGAGDKWEFLRVPEDTFVEAIILTADDLDDGTGLTVALKSTDGTTEQTHLAANAVGQAGGTVAAGAALPRLGGAAPLTIFAEVAVAAATPKAGEATLIVHLTRFAQ
jgi:hypothetical protein